MSDQPLSIADEVEAAIAAGSTQTCADMAGRVTALFLASAGRFNHEQMELFSDVFERLINTIELRAIADISARIALAELSSQLAPVPQAPASAVRRLARNDEISIAGPVLTESARLSNDDLIEIAQTKSEKHLLAIAGRWWLQEVVTNALLARRFPSVSRRLVDNPGSRVSPAGFAMIVGQAVSDPELAIATGIRPDLPQKPAFSTAAPWTEAVKDRFSSRAPPYLFEDIQAAIAAAAAGADREMARARDFAGAKIVAARLRMEGGLNEEACSVWRSKGNTRRPSRSWPSCRKPASSWFVR